MSLDKIKRQQLDFDADGLLKVKGETGDSELKKESSKPVWGLVADASSLGFSLALPGAFGALVGLWVDKKISTTPIFTLILLLLGTMVGIYNFYRFIKKMRSTNK